MTPKYATKSTAFDENHREYMDELCQKWPIFLKNENSCSWESPVQFFAHEV